MADQSATIAAQNDAFRKDGPTATLRGMLVVTAGIAALPAPVQILVLTKVQSFEVFDADNDPHGEHDFGSVDVSSIGKVFWKIDYYADRQMDSGSEEPADPARTYRVLTVMLAREY